MMRMRCSRWLSGVGATSLFGLVLALLCCVAAHAQPSPSRGAVLIGPAGQEVELYRNSYALVIGASQYRNGWPALRGVRDDVPAVRQALEQHGFEVETLEDPDAESLPRRLRDFVNRRGQDPSSRIVLYFSGHGHVLPMEYGGEMGYLVPVDAPRPDADEAAFRRVALDMEQLVALARRIQSRHALFVLDACFSGTLFSVDKALPPDIGFRLARPVREFITSGAESETVPDQSIFRRQFVAGLGGEADRSGDGYVTGTELGEFLAESVARYTRGGQHPLYGKIRDPNLDRGDLVFEVKGRASTSPVALDHGFAWLNAYPQAAVRIDGRALEAFPVQSFRLPAGRHVVSYEWGPGQRLEKSFELAAGGSVRCTAWRDRAYARCIDGEESGAPAVMRERTRPVLAASIPGGRGLAAVLPGTDEKLIVRAIASTGPPIMLIAPTQVTRLEADPALIDDLRRRQLVQSFQPGDTVPEAICDPNLPTFQELLERVSSALDYLELERAGALLSQGWSAYRCEDALIRRDALGRYLFLSGLLQLYLTQDDGGLFVEAAGMDPEMATPMDYPRSIQERFQQAKQRADTASAMRVRLREEDLAGLELWVDGDRAQGTMALPPGRHFLQLRTSMGTLLGGTVAVLEPGSTAAAVTWPPASLRAPERSTIVSELRAMLTGAPAGRLSAALEELTRTADVPWLLLLGPMEGGIRVLILQPGKRASRYPVEPPVARRTGVLATVAAGAFTVASAGVYALFRAQMYPPSGPTEENTRLYTGAALGLAGIGLGLTGTAATVSLNWQIPPRLYRARASHSPAAQDASSAAAPRSTAKAASSAAAPPSSAAQDPASGRSAANAPAPRPGGAP